MEPVDAATVMIRAAERRDAEGIRTIYNHYVNHSTTLFDMVARTLDEQVQWIDEHSGVHPAVVAELDGVIVGFGSLSSFRARPAYSTTVEDSVYLLDGHPHYDNIGDVVDEHLLSHLYGTQIRVVRTAQGDLFTGTT